MQRMRTLKSAYEYIKQNDKETQLRPYALRQLVITGKLRSVRVGNKYLVDLSDIETLSQTLSGNKEIDEQREGTIRKISERIT